TLCAIMLAPSRTGVRGAARTTLSGSASPGPAICTESAPLPSPAGSEMLIRSGASFFHVVLTGAVLPDWSVTPVTQAAGPPISVVVPPAEGGLSEPGRHWPCWAV